MSESSAVSPGDVLAGKYQVERVIGRGGMGVVVAAHHLQLEERVAIKFLLPEALANAEVVGRFAREARAAVKIKSEHVARVIDVGELATGAPYMVMEYLEGSDLAAQLAAQGRFPISDAVSYILQACEALAEAHVLGIVHRDLKPANLFLASRPSGPPVVKVLDFGISKSTSPISQGQFTKTSAVMGSPLYMSPEQMMSAKTVDARADLWALGVVLYELLTGRVPFEADTMPELVFCVIQKVPAPLRGLRADVPEVLAEVVHRCLAKEPAGRYANVGELAVALAPFGPAMSHVSVDRIAYVLAPNRPSGERVSAPDGRTSIPSRPGASTPFDVSPVANTMPGVAPTLREGLTPGGSDRPPGTASDRRLDDHVAGAITSKPVSSEAPSIPGLASGSRAVTVAAGLGALLVIAGVVAWRSTGTQGVPPPSNLVPAASQTAASPATQPPPSPSPPEPPPAPSGASPSPSLPTASPAVATTPRGTQGVTSAASARARPIPAPAASSPSTKNCDVPYFLDDAGHRQYRRECFPGGP